MTGSPEYQRWQQRFSEPGYLFGTAPNGFLKSCAPLLPKGGKALAIADGEGRNGVFLAEQGLDVLSLDFSPVAQDKTRKLARERGVTLRVEQADITDWTWPDAEFDVVAGIFFQFATPAEREKIFAGIKKTLKPGGLLLIEGYGPKQLDYKTGGPSKLENLYTRDLLQQAFADFASLDIKEHDSVIEEGAGHGGMSALVDLIGRK
ncbi:MAG: methyltransferase domain-containing protein [Rhodopseudomonas sp.]|nr:methyltransferase domain-containing protein [Rhodopseudomonas sp.]